MPGSPIKRARRANRAAAEAAARARGDRLAEEKTGIPREVLRRWMWDPLEYARRIIPWGMSGTQYKTWTRMPPWGEEVLGELGREMRARADGAKGCSREKLGHIGVLVGGGHGTYKSSFLIPVLTTFGLLRPYSVGIMTASSIKQLESRAWAQLKVLVNTSPILKELFTATNKLVCHRDTGLHGIHPEWGIVPMCPAPEANSRLFGMHSVSCTMAVCEESEGVPDANWAAFDGAMNDPFSLFVAVGNPVKTSGFFSDGLRGLGDWGKDWTIVKSIDTRDIPGRTRAQNDHLAAQIEAHGGEDSDWCRSRVRGLVPRSSRTQYIPEPLCRLAQARTRKMLEDPGMMRMEGMPVQMAVDLARGGTDETVVMYRNGLDAASHEPRHVEGRMMNPDETVQFIRGNFDRYLRGFGETQFRQPSWAYVDVSATGAEVTHALHAMGGRYLRIRPVMMGASSPVPECLNFRAYAWQRTLSMLERGVMLPLGKVGERLIGELTLPEFDHDNRGQKLQIEKKESIKARTGGKSIDFADTFTMLCLEQPADIKREYLRRAKTDSSDYRRRFEQRRVRAAQQPWRAL